MMNTLERKGAVVREWERFLKLGLGGYISFLAQIQVLRGCDQVAKFVYSMKAVVVIKLELSSNMVSVRSICDESSPSSSSSLLVWVGVECV